MRVLPAFYLLAHLQFHKLQTRPRRAGCCCLRGYKKHVRLQAPTRMLGAYVCHASCGWTILTAQIGEGDLVCVCGGGGGEGGFGGG